MAVSFWHHFLAHPVTRPVYSQWCRRKTETSGQSNYTYGRIAAVHGLFISNYWALVNKEK